MKILGISAYYHDSAAAIVVGGKIMAAAQEERFTRVKHTADFPSNAIKYCLEYTGLEIDELDAVVFYDKPFLKFERLLETYYAFAPKGLLSFLKAIPVWLNEKLFLKRKIISGLQEIGQYDKKKLKLLFTEHHLSHAASAFYPSSFNESAILTIDGVGEWCTASLGIGKGNSVSIVKEMNFPHSVGLLYSAFTYYLGFTVNSGEYKLMGLAPFGNPDSSEVTGYVELIKKNLVDVKEDGSIWLNQTFFSYATGLKMVNAKRWKTLFGFGRRNEEDEILQHHCDLALAIQKVTEEIVIKMAIELKKISGSENLCMAGGVALNCVANARLSELNIFKNIFIQPASGDAGGALGAALAVAHLYFNDARMCRENEDKMFGSYLGPDFSNKEVESMTKKTKGRFTKYQDFSELARDVSSVIGNGKVIGWFQGRMEFGPRALGNRSILADARNEEMQKKLNLKIKNREGFRPFAPSILAEDAKEYFDMDQKSPYMLFVAKVNEKYRSRLPENFQMLSLMEKLYVKRSIIPSATHSDFSARFQTVHKETNPRFHDLLTEFKKLSGVGILVNTSFNVRGEPIVCSPYDAYRCFMSTDMDYLVINDYLFAKPEQPDFENRGKWQNEFKKD
jgi:carbamoyltransferase